VATYSDPTVISIDSSSKFQIGPFLVLIAGLLALAGAGFMYYKNTQVETEDAQIVTNITQYQSQLTSLQRVVADLTVYQNYDSDLHQLFDTQHHFRAVLQAIEPHLYKQMKVTSMQLTDQNTLTFTGVTHTYTDYAKIYASLTDPANKKYFKSVKPSSISKVDMFTTDKTGAKVPIPGQYEVNFSFALSLDPSVATAHE
jgi:hypothetical protein